jgi:hypothetical protein
MNHCKLNLAALIFLCGVAGCQSPLHQTQASQAATNPTPRTTADLAVRNNAFALLTDLLNDESNLSKILLIKFESPELDRLVTDISKTAEEGAKLLERISKSDPALAQSKLDLPPGETATRKAIASTKKDQLLGSKGRQFEFELLLTQVQALNYGAHLASVIAANEPNPAHAEQLSHLSARFHTLLKEVTALLRTK